MRRVPWKSTGELDALCRLIYADDDKQAAIDILSAWNAATPLPLALDATLGLLVSLALDESSTSIRSLALRHTYASALVRLVNGLLDPLQLGRYAVSLHVLAAQIGLPASLVQTRHAATHEDLPILDALRDSARRAMAWLLRNYFLPTLEPGREQNTASPSDRKEEQLALLSPLLKQYKSHMKQISKDVSLQSTGQRETSRVMRDVDRWIVAQVSVSTWGQALAGRSKHRSADTDDEQEVDEEEVEAEKEALERFSDALLETGRLVPVAKKKRKDTPNVAVWEPLLRDAQSHHTAFVHTLVDRIAARLSNCSSDDQKCLEGWICWLTDQWPEQRTAAVRAILLYTGRRLDTWEQDFSGLVESIVGEDANLLQRVSILQQISPRAPKAEETWTDGTLRVMQERLDELLAGAASDASSPLGQNALEEHAPPDHDRMNIDESPAPPGWTRLDKTSWKPCPIGVYYRDNATGNKTAV